jgi:signal transduction histidine kinase
MSVLTFDRDLNVLIAAGGVLVRNGYDPAAMVGRHLATYIPPKAFQVLGVNYQAALDGQSTDFDYSSPVDGREYRVRVRPVTGADGSVVGGLALHEDVSEERAARSQLEQVQQLSHVGGCSYLASTGWEFDPELLDLLGIESTAEGLAAIDFLVVPEDREATRTAYRAVLASGGQTSLQYRMRHGRTGELRHVLVACEAVVDSDGKLMRAIITHADITDAVNSRQLAETAKVAAARARSLLLRRFSDALSADFNSLYEQLRSMTEVAAATLGEVAVLRILAPDTLTVERDIVAHPDPASEAQLTVFLKDSAPSFDPNSGLHGLVAARGEVVSSIGNYRWRRELEDQTGQTFLDAVQHFLFAPVRHDGAILGSLSLYRSDVDAPYEVGDDDVIQVLADRIGAAIAESRVRAVVEKQRVEGDAVAHRLQELTSEQRELLDQLAEVEERERIVLAEAVHDDPMQIIVAAIMRMDMLSSRLSGDVGTELEQLATMLETSVDRLRTLIVALMPPNLTEDIGVVMGNLAEGIFMGTATTITVAGSWDCELSAGVTGNAFRILREGLVNARKHARATHLTLELQVRDVDVVAVLTDDGVGAEVLDAGAGHLGVATMRARATTEGGELRITSSPGNGTIVRLTLPRLAPT